MIIQNNEVFVEKKQFLNGRHVKVTPMDEYGPCRFEGKITKVEAINDLLILTIRLFRPHDVRWQEEEIIYFFPNIKRWSLCTNVVPSTELMIEIIGLPYFEHSDEYTEYGLSVSGDDVRRLIKRKLDYFFIVSRKGCKGDHLDPDHNMVNIVDLYKGTPLRIFVMQILKKWPEGIFENDEVKMLRTYLSYYKQF